MNSGRLAFKLLLSLTSILASLVFLELAVRGYLTATSAPPPEPPGLPPLHVVVDSPVLYSLNPEHPEISAQGLRDREVSIPKPAGTFRILVLGDSVTYGFGVSRDAAFPKQLERLLAATSTSVEVINAAVSGYSAYNQLQYYLTKGREFEPGLVIVAFCLNDVANPRLHWNYTQEKIADIPPDAIPNHDYDRRHALPIVTQRERDRLREQERNVLQRRSALYQSFETAVGRRFPRRARRPPMVRPATPTHVTGEDSLSIEVLLDDTSPEWRWLTSMYDRLDAAVRGDRAGLMIAFLPVAYQMDKDYPFVPQERLMEHCSRRSVGCLDLLPAFRPYPKEDVFRLQRSGYDDIWHLMEFGHTLVAEAVLRFLHDTELIDGR